MITKPRYFNIFLACILFFHCALAGVQTEDDSQLSKEIATYPTVLINILNRSTYLEDAIATGLRYIRQSGENPKILEEKDIKKSENDRIRQTRIRQVSIILAYDQNDDGIVTKKEILEPQQIKDTKPSRIKSFQERQKNTFKQYDTDENGKITFKEMRTLTQNSKENIARQLEPQKQLLLLDPNNDKKLTANELTKIITQAFELLDINKDSNLSREEKNELILVQRQKSEALAKSGCVLPYPAVYDKSQNYQAFKNADKKISAYINHSVPTGKKYELHVIGAYKGSRHIQISPSAKPLVLVLASYEASLWTFDIHPKAKVKEIILQGNKEQRVKEISKNIKITVRPRTCARNEYKWEPKNKFEGKANKKFSAFIKDIQQFTGLIESSFQGSSKLPAGIEVPFKQQGYEEYKIVFKDPSAKATHKESIEKYKKLQRALPKELSNTFKTLIKMMEKGKLPVHFPDDPTGETSNSGARFFEELNFTPKILARTTTNSPTVECPNRDTGVILGDNEMNNLTCSWGNQIYWAGNGIDHINDAWGADLINAGKGNDMIDAGWGRDIIVFEKNWGSDVVEKTCHRSNSPDITKMYGYETNKDWAFPYINFIVFGPGIYERDMEWQGQILMNKRTNDSITFYDKCFNFIYYEDK